MSAFKKANLFVLAALLTASVYVASPAMAQEVNSLLRGLQAQVFQLQNIVDNLQTKVQSPATIAQNGSDLATSLKDGDTVETLTRLSVRKVPSLDRRTPDNRKNKFRVVRKGAAGKIDCSQAGTYDCPTIADGYVWWFVNYEKGKDGWSAEKSAAKVYLAFAGGTPVPVAGQIGQTDLSLRNLKGTSFGVQVELCNTGNTVITNFPVRISSVLYQTYASSTTQDFAFTNLNIKPGSCLPNAWPYSMWGMEEGDMYYVTAYTDYYNSIPESNELNNRINSYISKPLFRDGGGYKVNVDASAPTEKWVYDGMTGITLNVLKFTATSEAMALTDLRLQLDTTGSSTGYDFRAIELYEGTTLIKRLEAPLFINGVEDFVFNGPRSRSGCTGSAPTDCFIIPKDGSKLMTVKADLATIGLGYGDTGTAGQLVGVDFDGAGVESGKQKAVGVTSGISVHPSSYRDQLGQGVVTFAAVPMVTKDSSLGPNFSGYGPIYRFKVKATGGDIKLNKVTVKMATSSIQAFDSTTAIRLYSVTKGDYISAATAASAEYFKSGKNYDENNNLIVRLYADNTLGNAVDTNGEYLIYSGQEHILEVRAANISNDSTAGGFISTTLLGDQARPVKVQLTGPYAQRMAKASVIDTDQGGAYGGKRSSASSTSFIWSDLSSEATTTANINSVNTADWMNGYRVPGLPSSGLGAQIKSFGGGGGVTPDITPPIVAMDLPSGSTATSTRFIISGTAYDGRTGISQVKIDIYDYAQSRWTVFNYDVPLDSSTLLTGVTYSFYVPEGAVTQGAKAYLNVKAYDKAGNMSNTAKTVYVLQATPTSQLTILSPNGGEMWQLGNTHTIKWSPYNPISGVNPASDVTAYLEKYVNGNYARVGRIIECGKASIHWDGSLDKCGAGGRLAVPGQYYVYLVNNKTGQWDRSDKPFTLVIKDYIKADLKINGSDGPITVPAGGATYQASWASTNAEACTLYNDTLLYTDPNAVISNLQPSGSMSMKLLANNAWYGKNIRLICTSQIEVEGSAYDQIGVLPLNISIAVTSPNGGELWNLSGNGGDPWNPSGEYSIRWKSSVSLSKVSIALYKNDASYAWIVKDLPVSDTMYGLYGWLPSSTISASEVGNNVFKIYILGYKQGGGTVDDKSDAPFSIVAATSTPSISVLSPNGGEKWPVGLSQTIKWGGGELGNVIGLKLIDTATNNYISRSTIALSTKNDGMYTWTIPSDFPAGDYLMQISCVSCPLDASGSLPTDTSDASFSIVRPATTELITINNVSLFPGTITIDGDAVPYTINFTNNSSQILSDVDVQGWILQSGMKRAARGYSVGCGSVLGDVPPGTCVQSPTFWVSSSSNMSGYGTVEPGNATALIEVRDRGGKVFASETVPVTLVAKSSINIISPNGGESFIRGAQINIRWNSSNATSTVLLELRKGSSPYVMIRSASPNTGSYTWTIPSTFQTGSDYKIRVTDHNNRAVFDESGMPFNIVAQTVSKPNLLSNGGFEDSKVDWTGWGGRKWLYPYYHNSGSMSAAVAPALTSDVTLSHDIIAITGGVKYAISGYIMPTTYYPKNAGEGAFIRITWKNSNGGKINSVDVGPKVSSASFVSRRFVLVGPTTLTAPNNAAKMKLELVVERADREGNGNVYFDDINFSESTGTAFAPQSNIETTSLLSNVANILDSITRLLGSLVGK